MHVENITSNAMSLDRNGQSMLIQVYEKEIDRLNNIINYIWQVFENGSFEDGCDCIKIYDYLKELKECDKE